MKQATIYCHRHGFKHKNDGGWKYTKLETEDGYIWGWVCAEVHYPEFVPQRIKDERPKHLADQIQSHRGGELSKEFVNLYPQRVKKMVNAGVITKEEVKKAKPVWKDLPNIHNVEKTKGIT